MITISEAREAARGRPEFSAREVEGVLNFDYAIATPYSFTPHMVEIEALGSDEAERRAWIRRNLRGISFRSDTGELLSLPLHKFFNLNESPSVSFDCLKGAQASIYEKLDGTMVHFFRKPCGELAASTCRGHQTQQAKQALELAEGDPKLMGRLSVSVDSGLTPVFELVAPWNQVVVRYDTPRLVYLVSRNRANGSYVHESDYPDRAKSYDFPFSEIGSRCDVENFEGFVCHLDTGEIIKVKTPWYRRMHRSIESIHKPSHFIYDMALEGKMDDLVASCGEMYKEKLSDVWSEVAGDLLNLAARLNCKHREILDSAFCGRVISSDDRQARKEMAEAVRLNDPEWFSEHMALFGGGEVKEMLKRRLSEKYRRLYTEKFHSRVIA